MKKLEKIIDWICDILYFASSIVLIIGSLVLLDSYVKLRSANQALDQFNGKFEGTDLKSIQKVCKLYLFFKWFLQSCETLTHDFDRQNQMQSDQLIQCSQDAQKIRIIEARLDQISEHVDRESFTKLTEKLNLIAHKITDLRHRLIQK